MFSNKCNLIDKDEAEYSINNILDEINEIASYEEKYRDIITPKKTDTRTGEEIMNDVVKKAGLKVV